MKRLSMVFFCFLTVGFVLAFNSSLYAASVPLVQEWRYNSWDNNDYRSFDSGTMTINVTEPANPLTTWPWGWYPAGSDFTVSVDFENYNHTGSGGNPSNLVSDIQLAIRWNSGSINGEPISKEVNIRRNTWDGPIEGFAAIYQDLGDYGYDNHLEYYSGLGTDNAGRFIITKTGNSVTATVQNTSGTTLYSWTFSSVDFNDEPVNVLIRCINGPFDSTSADFSNFDMDPVPYDVLFYHVRFQNNESGSQFNRAVFGIRENSGNYSYSDVVTSYQLTDPIGNPISVSNSTFGIWPNLSGSYDANNGRWSYGSSFAHDSSTAATFTGELIEGDYHLQVNVDSGLTYDLYKSFGPKVELPVIESSSFYTYMDASNNLHWWWDPPTDPDFFDASLSTSVRTWVSVYDGDDYVGDVFVRVPTHLGYTFIPSDVVSIYESMGDNFEIGVQMRTNDNSNRSYSASIPLEPHDHPPVKGDFDGDGTVGLAESINALRVSAGL